MCRCMYKQATTIAAVQAVVGWGSRSLARLVDTIGDNVDVASGDSQALQASIRYRAACDIQVPKRVDLIDHWCNANFYIATMYRACQKYQQPDISALID
jgi:hypothetical protein